MLEIISILADRERHSRDPRSSNFPSDASLQVDAWADVKQMAESLGFSVSISGNYVNFYRESDGSFGNAQYNEGGARDARAFLEEMG